MTTNIHTEAKCSMCNWYVDYYLRSDVFDALELAHQSNVTLDPMLTSHIKEKHTAFGALFEAGRSEGLLITEGDPSEMNKLRGAFSVTHTEHKTADVRSV